MNQQQMDNYYEYLREILKKVQDEVKKLKTKEEELNRREQDILTIKDNTTQILQLLKEEKKKHPRTLKDDSITQQNKRNRT